MPVQQIPILPSNVKPLLTSAQVVNNFAALPPFAAHQGEYWQVDNAQGSRILFNYKAAGVYKADATEWRYIGDFQLLMTDDLFIIEDDVDATKRMNFVLDGITSGQLRSVTIPDKSGTMAMLSDIGVQIIIDESITMNGVYAQSSTIFAGVPHQIMVPKIDEFLGGATKIEAKFMVSTFNTNATIGEVEIYDYTDSASIAGLKMDVPNGGWGDTVFAGWIDITAYIKKAIIVRIRVKSGGFGQTQIESCKMIYKITK